MKWWQYDPTKWFISVCEKVGLATHLQRAPDGVVKMGEFAMMAKMVKRAQDGIEWPRGSGEVEVVSWEMCK